MRSAEMMEAKHENPNTLQPEQPALQREVENQMFFHQDNHSLPQKTVGIPVQVSCFFMVTSLRCDQPNGM